MNNYGKGGGTITKRSGVFDMYVQDINKYPLLSHEQHIELAKKAKVGCKKSADALVNSNLRFVISVANKYALDEDALKDLINEGNIGLIKAVSRFDETKGFKFISYAVWWIRQSILTYIYENMSMFKIPTNITQDCKKIADDMVLFFNVNGYEPDVNELENITGLHSSRIETAFEFMGVSEVRGNTLQRVDDTTVGAATFFDLYCHDDNDLNEDADKIELKELIAELTRHSYIKDNKSKLTMQQYNVLTAFLEYDNVMDAADNLNISTSRFNDLLKVAVVRLKKRRDIDCLKDYL